MRTRRRAIETARADDPRDPRRPGQFHRHLAHLRPRPQRAADRRGDPRARRPAAGVHPRDQARSRFRDRAASTAPRRAARSRRASRRSGSTTSTSSTCTTPSSSRTSPMSTGPKGSMAELMKMKEEGFCDAVGLGAGDVDVMMPLLRDWDFDVVLTHNRFTLINRNAEEMIDFAISRGHGGAQRRALWRRRLRQGLGGEADVLLPRRAGGRARRRSGRSRRSARGTAFRRARPRSSSRCAIRGSASTVCGVSKPERVAETLEWAQLADPGCGVGRAEGASRSRGKIPQAARA